MDRSSETLARLRPAIERARTFSGWDLSAVRGRPLEPGPPWDYDALARAQVRRARSVLDMGTGGGERLAQIVGGLDLLETRVVATEEWVVNAPVAYHRLAPLGIPVIRCMSVRLPFRDAAFDLVLSRHEELDPAEVARVLRPGGQVITQQTGWDDWPELWRFFPPKPNADNHYERYARGFEAAGLAVHKAIHQQKVAYAGLEDVALMLLLAPWTLPGFDLERDIGRLLALEDACRTEDGIALTETRYLMTAQKVT